MKKSFALAALLAATAFTPALAQEEPRQERQMADGATAAEPTPIPERVMVEMAQRERGERGPRAEGGGEAPRPQWGGGQGDGGQRRAEGGWQRPQQTAPVYQAPVYQAPVYQAPAAPAQAQQAAPVERQWNRGDTGGTRNWQGQQRPDWSARSQGNQGNQQGWSRPTPPVATAPVPAQPQGNWQNREQRRDTWRNDGQGNGGVVVQRQDDRRQEGRNWNGNNGWNGQNRNDGRRNDTWQNNGRNYGQWNGNERRNDGWQNNGRNDTWRNDGWNNGRSDGWRSNNRYDQRSQWQNQYRDWNRSWSRDWRRDQRYDWQRYRSSNRDLFYGNRYYAPYGWNYGYRRFSVGFSLSYLLYDQQYWIDDPYSYRLPPVYGPYRWVRYYDDVLLVDLRSGQVVDAIYDFFE